MPQPQPAGSGLQALQQELAGYLRSMQEFPSWDTDEVMRALSAMAARAAEIRLFCVRDNGAKANAFRTKEIDPFLDQCDFQFKVHSRIQSVREMEFRMAGGQV